VARDPFRLRSWDELFGLTSESEVRTWQRDAAVALVRRRCPDEPELLAMLGLNWIPGGGR
jgi:hypothetical protein